MSNTSKEPLQNSDPSARWHAPKPAMLRPNDGPSAHVRRVKHIIEFVGDAFALDPSFAEPAAYLEAFWDSSEHPRDPDGRFAVKSGLDGSDRDTERAAIAPGAVEKAGDNAREDGAVSNGFKDKVQSALEALDPQVAAWWSAHSVQGIITARDASGWLTFLRQNEYGAVTANGQPQIVIDKQYTAGQVAQAIINAAREDMWPTGIGVPFSSYRTARGKPEAEFAEWRKKSYNEAAQDAAVLAEIHVGTIAGLTAAGDAVIAVHTFAEDGITWNSVIQALPLIGKALPMIGGAIILKIAGHSGGAPLELKIAKKTYDQFRSLPKSQQRAISKAAAKLNDAEAAIAYIAKEVDAAIAIRETRIQIHHLATNKGAWGAKFKKLFDSVGLDLDDGINKMPLPAHAGRHTEKYHQWVHDQLESALKDKTGQEAKDAMVRKLKYIRRKLEEVPRLPYGDGGLQ